MMKEKNETKRTKKGNSVWIDEMDKKKRWVNDDWIKKEKEENERGRGMEGW